jgi:hypothetical protein
MKRPSSPVSPLLLAACCVACVACAGGFELRLQRKTVEGQHLPDRLLRRNAPLGIPLNPQGAFDWPKQTVFIMGLQVGNQSARFNVMVDTGSGDFALARVGCSSCKGQSLWRPDSAEPIPCVSATQKCSHCVDEQCAVKVIYGDESGWTGVLYNDSVTLDGGPTVPHVRIAGMINITSLVHPFGSSETDGILGLSRDGLPTILDALVVQDPSCKPLFSLCADAATGNGLLSLCALGNHHVAPANWALMVLPADGGYAIAVEGLAVGSKKFSQSAPYVLVDSGTSALMLDEWALGGVGCGCAREFFHLRRLLLPFV